MRYRNNDTQKNGDIFNILIESLGDKAADHVDTALQKAAKEDPLLAESAYIVWQALHEQLATRPLQQPLHARTAQPGQSETQRITNTWPHRTSTANAEAPDHRVAN